MIYDLALPSLGLEQLGRAVILILAEGLEQELVFQQARWDTTDQEFAARMGTEYEQVLVETIPPERLHFGAVPSLIDYPIFAFPNAAVMAFQAQPGPGNSGSDMYHDVLATVFIEVMCKTGPYPDGDLLARTRGESLVNLRLARTTDAIHSLISKNPTLGGVIQGPIEEPPTVEIFDVTKRHETNERGPLWFWQGSRMEYRVRLQSAIVF